MIPHLIEDGGGCTVIGIFENCILLINVVSAPALHCLRVHNVIIIMFVCIDNGECLFCQILRNIIYIDIIYA